MVTNVFLASVVEHKLRTCALCQLRSLNDEPEPFRIYGTGLKVRLRELIKVCDVRLRLQAYGVTKVLLGSCVVLLLKGRISDRTIENSTQLVVELGEVFIAHAFGLWRVGQSVQA